MKRPSSWKTEALSISALLAACLVIALIVVSDYGQSWDEPGIYPYADFGLSAYRHFLQPGSVYPAEEILNYYGPAYFMGADLAARAIMFALPRLSQVDAWHFVYFLTFLAGALAVYLLCRRWVGTLAAWATTFILLSQPILWGNAFVNPKDLPFMAFFAASIYLGLEMVDRFHSNRPNAILVCAAGIVLGLTTSIRVAGPLAGVLVASYAFARSPRRSLPLVGIYTLTACVTAYCSWPFLWGAPVSGLVEAIRVMSDFPMTWKVLFMGRFLAGSELPWFYFPAMLSIQLTLPTLGLIGLGLVLAARRAFHDGKSQTGPLLLFAGWFVLPLMLLLIARAPLYSNARQLYFLLPGLFLLVGAAFESLFQLLPKQWLRGVLIVLCALPGLYGDVRLHPYEYVYYNQLVGGTGGAYRRYELDYWGTSYREVALWLNQHAPNGATIWAVGPGPSHLLITYLRPDLVIACAEETACGHTDYVVMLIRRSEDRRCVGPRTVYSVSRRGAALALVKGLGTGEECR